MYFRSHWLRSVIKNEKSVGPCCGFNAIILVSSLSHYFSSILLLNEPTVIGLLETNMQHLQLMPESMVVFIGSRICSHS